MARFKRKINWKSILSATLAVVILVGCAAGITALVRKDTKTISSLAFKRGDLDENGEYVISDQAIYTEEAFNCIGLRVEPEFEFQGTFDVFYYNYNGDLVETKRGLDKIFDEDHPLAKMARVVIHPEIPDDVDEDDFKIKFYEVTKLANKLKITVNKDQNYLYNNLENLYIEESTVADKSIANPENGTKDTVTMFDHAGAKATHQILVDDDVKEYHIYVRCPYPPSSYINIAISNADGQALAEDYLDYWSWFGSNTERFEWIKFVVEVPESDSVDHLRVSMPSNSECYIFGVK